MIDYGQTVKVVMARNNVFDFQTDIQFEAEFLHSPGGAGDVFILEVNGKRLYLNGNSQDFIAIQEI